MSGSIDEIVKRYDEAATMARERRYVSELHVADFYQRFDELAKMVIRPVLEEAKRQLKVNGREAEISEEPRPPFGSARDCPAIAFTFWRAKRGETPAPNDPVTVAFIGIYSTWLTETFRGSAVSVEVNRETSIVPLYQFNEERARRAVVEAIVQAFDPAQATAAVARTALPVSAMPYRA